MLYGQHKLIVMAVKHFDSNRDTLKAFPPYIYVQSLCFLFISRAFIYTNPPKAPPQQSQLHLMDIGVNIKLIQQCHHRKIQLFEKN